MTAYSVPRMLGGSYAVAAVVWALFVAIGTLVSPTPAPAAAGAANLANDPDYLACQKAAGDESISACGRAIESGKWNGADLSALYRFRGFARVHDGKHDTDAALSDYGEAIRLDPDNFVAYHLRVDLYITERKYDLAVKEMDRLIELKPTPDNYFQRALAYEAKGDIDAALKDINKALSLNPPDNLKPYVYLEARKLIHAESTPHPSPAPAASSARAPAAAAQAAPPAPASSAKAPTSPPPAPAAAGGSNPHSDYRACLIGSIETLAINERGNGKYDVNMDMRPQALRRAGIAEVGACGRAIDSGKFRGPALVKLYVIRGSARLWTNDVDGALSDFDQVIKLEPDNAEGYDDRGYAYYKGNDFDRALADYDEAIKLKPDYVYAYLRRGNVYFAKDDFDRALADYDEAIKLKPVTPALSNAYFHRGNVHAKRNERDAALADYNKALSLYPPYKLSIQAALDKLNAQGASRASNTGGEDASAEAGRRACNEASGDQAIAGCNLAIASGKFGGDALAQLYANRGVEFIHKKNIDDAVSDFNQAIKLKPDYAMAYNNRGYAYSAKGDFDRAKADYYKALSLDPSDKVKKEIQAALDKLNAQGASQIRPR